MVRRELLNRLKDFNGFNSNLRSGRTLEELISIVEMYKLKQSTSLHNLAKESKKLN